ncbi:MAG: RNA methyltransferase [Cyanobacteria bacterium J06639_1]
MTETDPAFLASVRVVLVEPAGALNLGSIARVMKNMGVSDLWLVAPRCHPSDREAVQMAVHAAEVLENARRVSSLAEAIAGCQWVVGTAGRLHPSDFATTSPREQLSQLVKANRVPGAIVFGPEDRGLNNRELAVCQHHVTIPSSDSYPSLNLAQAVGICLYELRMACLTALPVLPNSGDTVPADVMEGFYGHLEALLLKIGYLHPHTAQRKLEKFRRLFNRARLTKPEVALLRGVVRQLGWAYEQPNPNQPKPSHPTGDRD